MVKKLEFEGSIEFASPETVFKFLYEDDAFIKFYHKEVSDDNNASASSWSEEDGSRRREVTFKPRVTNVPFLFRRLLGGDIARLTDVQHCTRNGNAFTIHSELSTAVFSGSTLVTHGDTILSPAEKGCGIVVYLTLELQTRLWGLQGRVEMYAEREARAVFKRWLNIARVFCEEKLGLEEEPLLEEEASSEDEDSFYDTEDLAQEDVISTEEELNIIDVISTEEELNIIPVTGLPTTPSLPTTPTTPSLRHSESRFQDWFVQEVWRSYCISVQNHAKLQKIEREIFLLNSSWTAFGLGIATGLGLVFMYNRQLNRQK